ncbi:phage virion morphogenesis protein [Hymenobacter sp. H14-R3]|uniref:phage virion morphogenesis protein n=1 Tax=Hymenobacter sp. H14-R3 TaxID=3046308 RepID=UPI0024B8E3CE|nr:phage virion morphogenesis protein [Hymenobacter sp. H14-R3]MDJ0363584.1 phage virion morphogenesis protein [Hymenobacter sp. H14-R3]
MAGQMNGLAKSLPGQIGALALESIDDNFRSQSFFGTPWKPRVVTKGNDGRALLVQSGRLRRSFKLQNSGFTVVLFTDVPYAEIHNEGGTIAETVTVASHSRSNKKRGAGGAHQVREHTRQVNTTIPQRQFAGEHPQLDNAIESLLERQLSKIFDL